MKKTIRSVAIILLIVILGSFALAEGKITTTGSVHLRKGPGLNYDVITTVAKGRVLSYDKTAKDDRKVTWYRVKVNGKHGWISSKYAKTGKSSSKYVMGDTGKSNIHTGPGLSYKTVGVLHKKERALYLNKTSVDDRGVTWYKIRWNGKDAWVSSRYTTLVTDGSSRKAATNKYVKGDTGKSNIHTGPGLKYKTIGVLHKQEKAEYLGKTSTDDRGVVWYMIRWDGRDAWVSSKYTKIVKK